MTQYITHWKNSEGDQRILSFDLFDNNSIVDSWKEVIERKLAVGKFEAATSARHFAFPTLDSKEHLHDMLAKCVTSAQKFVPELYWPNTVEEVSQDNLNYLHEEFHRVEEKEFANSSLSEADPESEVGRAFIKINHLIHALEKIIRLETKPGTSDSLSYMLINFGDHDVDLRNDVTEDQREFFKETYHDNQKKAQLWLGYATVGKNLHHCVIDDDPQVVLDDMVRPQTTVGGEAMLVVQSENFDVDKTLEDVNAHNAHIDAMRESFMDRHNLSAYLDDTLPENRWGAQPQLGVVSDIHDDWTLSDYYELCEDFTLISAELRD